MRPEVTDVSVEFAGNVKIALHFLANFVEVFMVKKRRIFQHSKTTNHPLREQIDVMHPLVVLADMIDWTAIEAVTTASFAGGPGRPPLSSRLIAGLLYLEHAFKLSDEQVVAFWLENAYWQVFTGETYLQTEPPINPSSLSRWR